MRTKTTISFYIEIMNARFHIFTFRILTHAGGVQTSNIFVADDLSVKAVAVRNGDSKSPNGRLGD